MLVNLQIDTLVVHEIIVFRKQSVRGTRKGKHKIIKAPRKRSNTLVVQRSRGPSVCDVAKEDKFEGRFI